MKKQQEDEMMQIFRQLTDKQRAIMVATGREMVGVPLVPEQKGVVVRLRANGGSSGER